MLLLKSNRNCFFPACNLTFRFFSTGKSTKKGQNKSNSMPAHTNNVHESTNMKSYVNVKDYFKFSH